MVSGAEELILFSFVFYLVGIYLFIHKTFGLKFMVITEMEPEDNQKKLLKYLVAVEKLGQEILTNRQELVMLDKRRNINREAISALRKSEQVKCYITVGSVLVKHNVEQSISLLESEQIEINIEINKLQSDLKVKVNELRDLEMLPPVPGLTLKPVSESDKYTLGLY